MKRRGLVVFLIGAAALGTWFAVAQEMRAQGDPPAFTAPQGAAVDAARYRNVQLLGHLSVDDMHRMMGFFNRSLGVECSYCHDLQNWASDANPHYKVAREMIAMVQDINTEVFVQGAFSADRITCFTCHRGTSYPERVPRVTQKAYQPSGETVKPGTEKGS